jgi:predicted nucleic acid-binding protein
VTSTGELLVADTSFISPWARVVERADVVAPWASSATDRIASATVAISVVTVAEVRFGHWQARWGQRRLEEADRFLRQLVQFPVDESVAEVWAHLKASGQQRGCVFGVNDLWIAATGQVRNVPIVTCDRDFLPMREFGVQVIFLPRNHTASAR